MVGLSRLNADDWGEEDSIRGRGGLAEATQMEEPGCLSGRVRGLVPMSAEEE